MIYTKSLIIIDTQNFLFYNICVMGYNHKYYLSGGYFIMEKQGNKALGIVAIILGAVAIVTFYIPVFNIVSLICGIVGLVLAILAKKSFTEAGQTSPLPTVGLVLSIIGLALAAIGFFTCTVCTACVASEASKDPQLANQLSNAINSAVSSVK